MEHNNLGQGTYGTVCKGRHKVTKASAALLLPPRRLLWILAGFCPSRFLVHFGVWRPSSGPGAAKNGSMDEEVTVVASGGGIGRR